VSAGLSERSFEDYICDWLVADGGYREFKIGTATPSLDVVAGLDVDDVFGFLFDTQPDEWAQLCVRHGSEPTARKGFLHRLVSELAKRGTVDVLRHGVEDLGINIRLAFPQPAHELTPEVVARYEANRLTVIRQLPYKEGSDETIDLGLFVNGIPTATAELKNQVTGQNVDEAVKQYRRRDPGTPFTSRLGMVHFAVDTERVMMTTHLDGDDTEFLPFNQGHDGGKGNPPNPDGHTTAYLWEQAWSRDNWMDLLFRYVHQEKSTVDNPRGRVIFPRFHQWDAVSQLEADCKANGAGSNYLVQHSTGSGKSNTIAWLCHRLHSLHRDDDTKVFDKVIVITDRIVLDEQLQETIYQFEHAHGLVQKIDRDSKQLAEALTGHTARIIITTLQKFPFILDKVSELGDRSYAIVADEAHSSQSGESAKALRIALGHEDKNDDEDEDDVSDPIEAALVAAATARGRQPNLSYFAFTGTPKNQTLELFGNQRPDGKYEAFHLYPMRQAIEEGFILDVLANYTTYNTYSKFRKTIEDDPELETAKANQALKTYLTLHPTQLSQKAQIITSHFQTVVQPKIGGRAKAMVVCDSRIHALKTCRALRSALAEAGKEDATKGNVSVLVAFSGTLEDDDGEWTETKANGLPESQTVKAFDTDDYKILVVAEKFQTGFNQSLLQAMYVDKPLSGHRAVQTLSRLNRIHRGKDGTFVLDFVNDAETIQDAYQEYYDRTISPPTSPNLMYDARSELQPFGVLRDDEIEEVVSLIYSAPGDLHKKAHAALKPALDRYSELDEDDQERFRKCVTEFVRLYAYLSQLVSFIDTGMERYHTYLRALKGFLRGAPGDAIDVSEKVTLTHLRNQKISEGAIGLKKGEVEVPPVKPGRTDVFDPDYERLSRIIATLNDRFALKLGESDRLHIESIIEDLVSDETLQNQAAANPIENFKIAFEQAFQAAAVQRLTKNEELTAKLLDDPNFLETVTEAFLGPTQGRMTVARQERIGITELLERGEDKWLEYKATFRTAAETGEIIKPLETASLKAIAGFLNSYEGGTLLIGVTNDGTVHGLNSDFASLHKEGKEDTDRFTLHVNQAIVNFVGTAAAVFVSIQMHNIDGLYVARVHVRPCGHPVWAQVPAERHGQRITEECFYVRLNGQTQPFDDPEQIELFISGRWPDRKPDNQEP